MFNKKRKQEKINKEQEQEILRFLRDKEIKKLFNEIFNEDKVIKEKDLIFDWMNDVDINVDFKLWEQEISGDCFNSDKGEL